MMRHGLAEPSDERLLPQNGPAFEFTVRVVKVFGVEHAYAKLGEPRLDLGLECSPSIV
jgi:hypothetical protein